MCVAGVAQGLLIAEAALPVLSQRIVALHGVKQLELAFETKSLRNLCENQSEARQKLGLTVAGKLKRRLADLRAAECVTEMVAGRIRELKGYSSSRIAVELGKSTVVVFVANHVKTPMLTSGDVDWARVRRIRILSIGDYR